MKCIWAIVCLFLTFASFSAHATEEGKIPYSRLTPEEREVLAHGEINDAAYVTGGILGTVVGLGIGQAVQGRYLPTGLIMTVGEFTSLILIEYGAGDCISNSIGNALSNQPTTNCSNTALAVGLVGFFGLRIWEIVDVWATPPSINQRYRDLNNHVDRYASMTVLPATRPENHSLTGGGLALQYHF